MDSICAVSRTLLAALVLATGHASATPEPRSPMENTLQQAAAQLPAGGFVFAEVTADVAHFRCIGEIGTPADVPPEHVIFEIGSITKTFTGLLLAQAALDGKVSLDDPISRHLPSDLKLDPHVAAITLRELSTHTSGLPRLPDNLRADSPRDPYALYGTQQLHAFLGSFKPSAPAPQPADYSNLGVGLLGHLLACAYGVSYAELVREKITGPLGMRDTVITLDAEQQKRFATPHSGSMTVAPWNFDALAGAGALRSTAADLTKFAQALCDEHSVIAAAWKLARTPHAPFGPGGQIGLGVFISTRDGHTVYSHGGGTGGFRSLLEVIPETRSARIVLLNNDDPDPAAILAAPCATATSAPSAVAPVATAPSREQLLTYTGVFTIDPRGRFTVVADEQGELRIRLTGQPFLLVKPSGHDRFAVQGVAAEYQFARDAHRKVSSVTLHQNGREIPAPRTADAPAVHFLPVEKLREYAGRYTLTPDVIFEIGVGTRTQTLTAKLTGQPTLPVYNDAPDHFVYDVVDAALTFERDTQGSVVAIVLRQNGLNHRAPRQPANSAK